MEFECEVRVKFVCEVHMFVIALIFTMIMIMMTMMTIVNVLISMLDSGVDACFIRLISILGGSKAVYAGAEADGECHRAVLRSV